MIAVLAGNRREWEEWIMECQYEARKNYRYIDSIAKVEGYEFDNYIVLGTFDLTKNNGDELLREVVARVRRR